MRLCVKLKIHLKHKLSNHEYIFKYDQCHHTWGEGSRVFETTTSHNIICYPQTNTTVNVSPHKAYYSSFLIKNQWMNKGIHDYSRYKYAHFQKYFVSLQKMLSQITCQTTSLAIILNVNTGIKKWELGTLLRLILKQFIKV